MRFWGSTAFTVLVAATGCEILPTNPLDPATEPDFQQRAALSGSVRAVVAPDADGSVPEPGACAAALDGDHSGFIVVLRGLANTGVGVSGESQATNSSGAFEFKDVPAGAYVVEVVGAGFALPDPTELTLNVGEQRDLGTLCAVKTAAPAAPLVEAPAALVDVNNQIPGTDISASVRILDVDGVTFRLQETPDGGLRARDEDVDAGVAVLLVLDPTPGTADDDVRRSWRVDVVAVDALGNASIPASFVVVKDGLAPLPPSLSVSAGRDRVQLKLDAANARANEDVVVDDPAATFLVAYAVIAPQAVDDPCPFGRPGVTDPVVHASFATEGKSPVAIANDTLTLSGVQPGTDMVVLAAGVDPAGNASCWSAPVPVRPDEITFVATSSVVVDPVAGTLASAATDGALVFARGAAGLLVVDRDGVGHDDETPASDVDVLGEQLLVAAGALGLRVIPLDDDGAPGTALTIALPGGASVDCVVARPGRALVGGDGGVFSVPLDGSAPARLFDDGDVHDMVAAGDDLVVLHDGVQLTISRYAISALRTTGSAVATATFQPRVSPTALLLLDKRLWLAEGALGVEVFDSASLALVGQRTLPGSAFAARLSAFDEVVLAGVDGDDDARSGSIFALDRNARLVGTHRFKDARLAAVFAVFGGVCAALSDVSGNTLACASTISAPLVDREVRFGGGDVIRVGAGGGQILAGRDGGGASVFSLQDGSARASVGGARADVVADVVANVGFLVGDRLLLHSGGVATVADLDVDVDIGFGAVAGDRLVLASVDQSGVDPVATVLVGRLVERDNTFTLTAIERSVIAGVTAMPSVVIARGRAFIATEPFGLLSVSVDGGDVDQVIPVGDDFGSGVGDIAFVGANVFLSGKKLVQGSLRERLFVLRDGAVDDNGVAESPAEGIGGITALGGRLVVSTAFAGVFVVDGVDSQNVAPRPVLQIPTLSQTGQTLPTSRGFVAADAGGGAVWVVLR